MEIYQLRIWFISTLLSVYQENQALENANISFLIIFVLLRKEAEEV